MIPIEDKDGTDCIIEGETVACHTKRVTSELAKITERALDKEVSMFREGQRSFGHSEDPLSETPLMRQFNKGISDALRSWVKDATRDLSTLVHPPSADGGALGQPGSQERLFAGVTRGDLTLMFEKQKKEILECLEGRDTGNASSKGSPT
ncbi:unnamed protein product [Ascophyllum nodosum]